MTQITIFIPELIEITENQTIERNRIPLIPATQILGQLLPEQIPLGVIPGLENFEQLDEGIQTLSDRVSAIEANDYLTGPELDEQLDDFQQQFDGFTASISSKAPQTALDAIASTVAAMEAEVGAIELELAQKAPTAHSHAIGQITGLSETLQTLADQIAALQAQDSDLTAIAALNTQPFGRSLLTLADLAATKALLEIPSANSQPSIGELVYTASQSTRWSNSNTWLGTYANLTDGSTTTGASTNNEGGNRAWIKADLGSLRTVVRARFAGGEISGLTGVGNSFSGAALEASTNDLDWTPLFTFGALTEGTRTHEFPLSQIQARYFRIARGALIAATEFRLFGF